MSLLKSLVASNHQNVMPKNKFSAKEVLWAKSFNIPTHLYSSTSLTLNILTARSGLERSRFAVQSDLKLQEQSAKVRSAVDSFILMAMISDSALVFCLRCEFKSIQRVFAFFFSVINSVFFLFLFFLSTLLPLTNSEQNVCVSSGGTKFLALCFCCQGETRHWIELFLLEWFQKVRLSSTEKVQWVLCFLSLQRIGWVVERESQLLHAWRGISWK